MDRVPGGGPRARARLERADPLERELIAALGKRYSSDFNAPRPGLDQAYAEAMRALGALEATQVLLVDPRRVTLGLREAVAPGVNVV